MQDRATMTWKTLIHGEDQTYAQRTVSLPVSIKRLTDLVIALGTKQTSYLFTGIEIEALVPESEWVEVETATTGELQVWAAGLVIRTTQARGMIPAGWDKITNCKHCGPVWSEHELPTLSCGWCWMRDAGMKFPKPIGEVKQ